MYYVVSKLQSLMMCVLNMARLCYFMDTSVLDALNVNVKFKKYYFIYKIIMNLSVPSISVMETIENFSVYWHTLLVIIQNMKIIFMLSYFDI